MYDEDGKDENYAQQQYDKVTKYPNDRWELCMMDE